MDWQHLTQFLGQLITYVGVPTILALLIYIGRKLQILDDIRDSMKNKLEPELQEVKGRFMVVEDRVETLWKDRLAPTHSPRQLNSGGQEILDKSGIKEIVDSKMDLLLGLVKERKPKNAYDAEQYIQEVMTDLPKHCPDIVDQLKDGAFRVGADLDAVLYVGSIYLRNSIFTELGFTQSDLQ